MSFEERKKRAQAQLDAARAARKERESNAAPTTRERRSQRFEEQLAATRKPKPPPKSRLLGNTTPNYENTSRRSAPAKTGTKSAPSTKGGGRKSPGYTYTGPKVGSAEYKAMRAKKQAGYKAKARANIAAKRAGAKKAATTARQLGTQKPNYESYQRGMRAPDSRQIKWTDNETTNQNLKASALRAQGDSGDKPKRSKLYGVRKVLSAMGYAGEVR